MRLVRLRGILRQPAELRGDSWHAQHPTVFGDRGRI
jgi:hypothetical protein